MTETYYTFEQVERIVGLTSRFLATGGLTGAVEFLNGLTALYEADSASIVHFGYNIPASILALSHRVTDAVEERSRAKASQFANVGVADREYIDNSRHTVTSVKTLTGAEAIAIVLYRPMPSFSGGATRSLAMIHCSVQSKLRELERGGNLSGRSSPRMQEVEQGLLDGLSDKEIASRLSISHHTVHVYVKAIYKLHGVNSRAMLISAALKKGEQVTSSHGEVTKIRNKLSSFGLTSDLDIGVPSCPSHKRSGVAFSRMRQSGGELLSQTRGVPQSRNALLAIKTIDYQE